MSDTRDVRSVAIIAIGAALVLAPLAGAAGAAVPTFDSETTDTSSQSDVTGGETINGFDASSSNYTYLEATNMTADGEFQFREPDLDVVIAANSSLEATDSANGYYAANVSHDALADYPIESGENVSVEIKAINDTTVDDPDTQNITIYLDGVEGRTVRYVGAANLEAAGEDASDDAFATTGTDGLTVPVVDQTFFADDYTSLDDTEVAVNGSNSTIKYVLANDTANSGVASVASNLDAGTWMPAAVLTVSDGDSTDAVRVYVDEAPDSVDTNSDTYAVYDTDEEDLTVHLGDDYESADSVDVSLNSRDGIIHLLQTSAFTYNGVDVLSQGLGSPLLIGGGQALGAGLIVVGFRRRRISAESSSDTRQEA